MEFERPVIDIAPVLEHYNTEGVVIPTGQGWRRMRCVFHPDGTPSASVNHQLRAYVCHSCGRSGDSIKLVRQEEGLSFADSLRLCQGLTGVESQPVPAAGWGTGSLLSES